MIERQHHTPEFLPGIVQGDQDGRAGMKDRCGGIHSYDCGTNWKQTALSPEDDWVMGNLQISKCVLNPLLFFMFLCVLCIRTGSRKNNLLTFS